MNYDLSFCLKSTIKNLSILDKNRRKKSIKKSKNYEIVFKVFDIIFCQENKKIVEQKFINVKPKCQQLLRNNIMYFSI